MAGSKEDRPIDSGIAGLVGKDEAAALEFWKQRFAKVSAIAVATARVGALLPALRQLSWLAPEERRRLTKARVTAHRLLPADQAQRIDEARKAAYEIDRELVESDDAVARHFESADGMVRR